METTTQRNPQRCGKSQVDVTPVCEAFNDWLSTRRLPLTETEFEQHLKEQGLLSEVPTPITDVSTYAQRQPVRVTEKPLSETMIEEGGSKDRFCSSSSGVTKPLYNTL